MSVSRGPNEWTLGFGIGVIWNVLGSVLAVVGAATFLEVYNRTHPVVRGLELEIGTGIGPVLITGLLLFLLIVTHELLHGLTMRLFGGRPRYGVGVMGKILPYFYCTAEGERFTRAQFATVALAPTVAISLLGALAVAYLPYGGWLVLPLGLHLGGCIGDVWVLGVVLKQPRGTMIEDMKTGVRFHRC
ncbi:MAG: DUF3267 domain-containing protein [Chloroflexota bacterium]|nr:DUF3267 domain-containing protein [Chloroflexota bacterium]